jgi:hypothetical protein
MIVYRIKGAIALTTAVAVLTILACANGAQAAAPVKLTLASQFGREVNLTEAGKGAELEDICMVSSKDECKTGAESSEPSGFRLAESVAVGPSGNVYVVDINNARIQEFTATGQFVLMFGKEVNETNKSDVCTAAEIVKSGAKCEAGVEGSAPGQLARPYSIAVDPASGDVYVAEVVSGEGSQGGRVQKFTSEGRFVLEIGKEVNESTKGNLCTHIEEEKGIKCTGPALREFGTSFSLEDGSFDFETGLGNLLAVGSEGKLYVGDEDRVQEFTDAGQFGGEIALEEGTVVDALALDQSGDLYLTNHARGNSGGVVREFDETGGELKSFTVSPEEPGATVGILGLAVDSGDHLAVTANQQLATNQSHFGSLYEASEGLRLTAFKLPVEGRDKGIAFNGTGELYVATEGAQEIVVYAPKIVAALTTHTTSCVPGAVRETDATFDCALSGEISPEGIAETQGWFEWGKNEALGEQTPKQKVVTSESLSSAIVVRPNSEFDDRLVAEDADAKAPEVLTGGRSSFATPLVPPSIDGDPNVLFTRPSSVVMFDKLNPENAPTQYFFEYAPGQKALAQCGSILEECFIGSALPSCGGTVRTPLGESGVYGSIGVTAEAIGLRPGTEYSYRLFAENENTTKTAAKKCASLSSEGGFTTATVPSPYAETGGYSAVGSTSAIASAMVDPDGAPVTYSFELGVYEGAETKYGVVSSGSVGASSGPAQELLTLTGLQPGTTYAYRIAISSGYIDNAAHTLQGQPVTFSTSGLPAVLQPPLVLVQLPVPKIAFPKSSSSKPKAKSKLQVKKKAKRGKAKKGKKKAKRSTARRTR